MTIEKMDVTKRGIGINLNTENVAEVTVWSPLANAVSVITKDIEIPLQKGEMGYWQTTTAEIKEGSLYKIQVDDAMPFPDPASLFQPTGVHNESEVVNLGSYSWKETTWNNLPLEDYIIYELHVGTFTAEGTFAAAAEKLDHLVSLGITAIEIMPVAQFPGDRNWGYDGVFPFAVQNNYGGPQGLQQLVDACHQKGLAVILDVVYNHLGPEGNYLGSFGPYFTGKYNTPWGNAINFDDEWCDGVRRYFLENALMWFRDFRIDALRLDAVHAIKDFSPVHILQEIRLQVDELMQQTGRKHYLIVELDLNDARFINPVTKGGFGMDAQWIDEFHHALRVTTGQEKTGYYSDFTGIDHLAKSYRDAYVYDGQWSPHRNKTFGIKAQENPGHQFIVFSQNHDQVGNRMLGERTSQLVSFETQKLMAAAVILSPFLPMLFMGEEWSEPHPFQYFVSHTDPELAEAVRKGRKAEFAAFHAQGEAPDPMAEETFNNSKLQWHLLNEGQHKTMLEFYKELIRLRKQNSVLKKTDRKNLTATPDVQNKTLIVHRWQENEKIICLMNFADEHRIFNLDKAGQGQILLDSADAKWGGPGRASQENDVIKLQLQSIVVLQQ
ncbi:MAG TPA: malto-oligosyltrehalose trehalohydrolase [Flavisolibacter sp.]|jgi:maltooligosyltrehalose trehalohydrolase|nr:malto-oligosyltrehalose trehalohydrolase [Flavisolibacter sp.]